MRRYSIIFLFLLSACGKETINVNPVDFMTAHVWQSTGYVINGRQYNSLAQYRAYVSNDTLSDLYLKPGDSIRYNFKYEILFTNDYVMKETRFLDMYYKCNTCNTFIFLAGYKFSSEEVYALDNSNLFVTAENVVLLDSASSNTHLYKLIDNQKMKLFDWRTVRNTNPGSYNVSVNGISVQPGEEIPVDFVFEASL